MMALPRDDFKCQHWLDAANWNVKISDFPTAERIGGGP
jgi:hypothetical protein